MGDGTLTGLGHAHEWQHDSVHERIFQRLVGLAKSMRPHQWYKQGVLFIGVVFSLNATNLSAWLDAGAGALVFSAIAGAVYMLNDVVDREADRAHPTKRERPIASGLVPVPLAVGTATLLMTIGFTVGWWLSPIFAGILLAYALQNAAYSTFLKEFLFLDLIVIGTGFVLRAVAGVVLIGAPLSPWLVLCTFLAALLLGIGKRGAEQQRVTDAQDTRTCLDGYQPELVRFMLGTVSATLLLAYSLYTFYAQTPAMMVTIPFALYAVFRYGYLVVTEDMERPERLFADRPMLGNLCLWAIATVTVLYLVPLLPVQL